MKDSGRQQNGISRKAIYKTGRDNICAVSADLTGRMKDL
jgi:hypothetical protein